MYGRGAKHHGRAWYRSLRFLSWKCVSGNTRIFILRAPPPMPHVLMESAIARLIQRICR